MCKFESSQKQESKAFPSDSLKTYSKHRACSFCLFKWIYRFTNRRTLLNWLPWAVFVVNGLWISIHSSSMSIFNISQSEDQGIEESFVSLSLVLNVVLISSLDYHCKIRKCTSVDIPPHSRLKEYYSTRRRYCGHICIVEALHWLYCKRSQAANGAPEKEWLCIALSPGQILLS